MPTQEEIRLMEKDAKDLKKFRMDTLDKEVKEFQDLQEQNMLGIDPQLLKNAGITDSRAHSNAGIFDLFVMGKYGVDMKDIPKFERGELEGHDKAQYLKEFETFLKEHPISTPDGKGGKIYHPENVRAWGELYKEADKKLSEYRLPDLDLGNPDNWQKVKDEVVLLNKIGTDWLQVIQEQQMEKFEVPVLSEAFQQGFGSEEAANHFWANIVQMQNMKGFFQSVGVEKLVGYATDYAARVAEGRLNLSQNQSLYGGKTLQEFRQNMPEYHAMNTLSVTPLGSRSIERMPEADRKAIEDYLEKGTPLPKNMEARMKADLNMVKNDIYPSMLRGEVGGQFAARPTYVDELKGPISVNGKGDRIKEVAQMTDEEKRAADLGFQKLIFPAYHLYGISMNMVDQGKNMYDLIAVNGKPLREHCEQKYDADPVFDEKSKWADLSEEEKRRFMRMEATRAALDQGEQVACYEFVPNAEGKLVISEKPAIVGRYDPAEKERLSQLPPFEEQPDEVLKASYFNMKQLSDPIITSLSPEKSGEVLNSPPIYDLEWSNDGSLAQRLYIEEGDDVPETITDYAQIYGNDKKHILKVQDPTYLDQFRDALRQAGDKLDQLVEERLTSKDEQMQYGNDLMHQIDLEEERLKAEKQVKQDYVENEGESVRAQNVRAKEALETAQKKLDECTERVNRLQEEFNNLPDGEQPDVYNPFSAGGDKKQKELELKFAKEELEQAEQENVRAQELVQKANERQKGYEEHLNELDERIDKAQKRYDTIKQQIESDVSPEAYEQIQEKTKAVLSTLGPNRLRRAAEGFSPDYLLTKTPFVHGAQSFGPAIDQSNEKSIAAKVALCSRNGFPVYDAMIAEDAAEQTLVDYWKDKDNKAITPQKEDQYRRRLYDQVSQLDSYLDAMYKTLDEPGKSKQLWDMQITDPGNEPWSLHEKAIRGTAVVKASAEAYKTGLEQGWHIDDLGTLASFNAIRKIQRNSTLHNATVSQNQYKEYEEPVYKDPGHKKWLDEMDKLWNKIEETPIRSAEQRKEILNEIQEKVRDGYVKGYLEESHAKGFHQTYTACRKRDQLIERDLEPAFVDTKGLTISDKGKERIQEIEDFREIDSIEPDKREKPDLLTEEELNQSFVEQKPKAEPETEAATSDWEMDQAFEDFNAKRSAVFLGRESTVHENLRKAAEKMRDIREKIGYPMKPDMLPEYLNALDEVIYASGQYQKDRADANTPAGKQRLEGAKEFEKMAKEELLRVKNAMNKGMGTNHELDKLRTMVARAYAVKSEEKIGELLKDGKTLNDKDQQKVMGHAATILAATLSNSALEASKNGFQTMGLNSVKKSILENKEFKSVCKDYLKQPGMTAEKMVGELKNGMAIQKMTKLRNELDIDDKAVEKLAEASKKAAPKKEEPKKKGPGHGGMEL